MSNRVRDMTAIGALTGTEKFYADNGADGYVTADQIKAFAALTGSVFVNIVEDYGAPTNGTDDASLAFYNFTQDYQGEKVVLYVPPGDYYFTDVLINQPGSDNFGPGITQLELIGYGARFFNDARLDNQGYFTFGTPHSITGYPARDPILANVLGDAYQARINTTAIGDGTVTCTTHAEAARFHAGDWVLISGFELLGFGDYAPAYYEFALISGVNASTGVVTLADRTLTDGPYRSDAPICTGDSPPALTFTSGPALCTLMHPQWAGSFHIRGVYFDSPWTNCTQRVVRYTDCTFKGYPLASRQQRCELTRCYIGDGDGLTSDRRMELDKIIEDIIFIDCKFEAGLLVQTADKRLYAENTDFGDTGLGGTCRYTTLVNCDICYMAVGPRAMGFTESLVATNCRIAELDDHITSRAATSGTDGVKKSDWTISNGKLTRANNELMGGFEVPGMPMASWINASNKWGNNLWRIGNVVQSGGNMTIETSLTDAEWAAAGSGDRIIPHPCIDMTVRGCYGCRAIEDLNSAPPHTPYGAFAQRTFSYNRDTDGTLDIMILRGLVKEVRVNVIRAYTGATNPNTFTNNSAIPVSTGSAPDFSTDARVAGERICTQNGITGKQTNDLFTNVVGAFIANDLASWGFTSFPSSTNPSENAIIQLTFIMDHGIHSKFFSGKAPPFQVGSTTFGNLPASPTAGQMFYVTNSNTGTWGATISGTGAFKVVAWYNGTNWTVLAA